MNFKEYNPETEVEWLELRQNVLTATEMSVILGLNKWQSVREILKKKNEPIEILNSSYIWLGHALEPVVVLATNKALGTSFKLYEESTGKKSFFADKELRLGATPDAWDGDSTLLECKSTKPANFIRYAFWPPAYYLAQLYTQLMATGNQEGYLAIMSTNLSQKSAQLKLPIRIHKLRRSNEMDKIFLDRLAEFWQTTDEGRLFRVPRKEAPVIEMKLRVLTEVVYDD